MKYILIPIVCILICSCKTKKESECDAYGGVTPDLKTKKENVK
jgi:hypothetical protein